MAHRFEVWTRPGDSNFGPRIADPPFRQASLHDGVNVEGDGTLDMPNTYDRFDDILYIDRQTPGNSVSSLVRVFSDTAIDPTIPIYEWLPRSLLPTADKNDPDVNVGGKGIKHILTYPRTEPFDWDGTDAFTCRFCDWIWGGFDLLRNAGFEDQTAVPIIYTLLIDATAGTFTLSDGTDTTSALAYNISDGVLEAEIEADIAAIDDVLVTPLAGAAVGYSLVVSATGGTFVINGPSDSTGNLAFNIGAAALETAIEGLTGITDVTVTAVTLDGEPGFQIDLVNPITAVLSIDTTNLTDGSASFQVSSTGDGFTIEFVNPPTGITLTVNDAGLTGDATLTLSQPGEFLPSSWMKSQQISTGTPREFGVYDIFEPSMDQAHTGSWSLKIDPGPVNSRIDAFAGTQQIVNVQEGGLYQASIWVRPTTAGQTYRLVIRGIDEDEIARADVSPPPNVWTQVMIEDVVIPDGDNEVIFRFANTNLSGDPTTFYIDDGAFTEGMAATTVGEIVRVLYESYTDPALHSTIYWDDGSGTDTPYLTPDFDDDDDSGGIAWADTEISLRVFQRMNIYQVLTQLAGSYGIEFRVVPDDVENGTWLLQIYNKGGMETDHTSAAFPAILGGSDDTNRQVRRFLPDTDHAVEGSERITARARNAALIGALGKIGGERYDRTLPTIEAVTEAASEDSDDAVLTGQTWNYKFVNPRAMPLTDYKLGDKLNIHDPPEADGPGRAWDVIATFSPDGEEWEVEYLPEEETSP